MRVMAPGKGFIIGPGCALAPEIRSQTIHILIECARTTGILLRERGAECAGVSADALRPSRARHECVQLRRGHDPDVGH
jgi:hypothetical protein